MELLILLMVFSFGSKLPDMKVPISFALSWPDRSVTKVKFIDFIQNNELIL